MDNIDFYKNNIDHSNSIYVGIDNKLDITKITKFDKFLSNLLWYSYNNESKQPSYENLSNYSTLFTDNRYDYLFEELIKILLNLSDTEFIIESTKQNAYNQLNNLQNFNNRNSLVMYYKQKSNNYTFIITFLRDLRNSLAHGAFNFFVDNELYNELYISNEKFSINEIQIAIRLISENIHEDSFNKILLCNIEELNKIHTLNDLLIYILKFVGFTVLTTNNILSNSEGSFMIQLMKNDIEYNFYCINYDKVEQITNEIIDNIKESNLNYIFYIAYKKSSQFNKSIIENKIEGLFINKDNYYGSIKIYAKDELMDLTNI